MQQVYQKDEAMLGFLKDCIAGTLGGVACLYSGHPFDTCKVRLQLDTEKKYRGPIDCMIKMAKQEGVSSLFKGATPSLVSMMLENGILFVAYNQIKQGMMSFHQRYRGKEDSNLSLLELAIAGSAASFFSSFALCPTELIKCRLQADNRYKNPMDCTIQTIKSDGFTGLFRGLSGTLMREMPGSFAFFGAYELSRYLLAGGGKDVTEISPFSLMLAGGLGGVAFWATVYPVDMVKSFIQTENGPEARKSFWAAGRHIYASYGLRAFYRGIGVTLFRSFPSNAALFFTYEWTKQFLDKHMSHQHLSIHFS